MQNRFWVYIVASKTGTLYTGMTNSLDRRVIEHKQHLVPGFRAISDKLYPAANVGCPRFRVALFAALTWEGRTQQP